MSGQESVTTPDSSQGQAAVSASLTPDRWQQVKELFAAAQERDLAQRAAFLKEACGEDESLRAEVESLLLAAVSESSDAGVASGSALADARPSPLIGQKIGAYRIEKQIGRGGMASVYLASRADEQYQKQAAIKILLPELDSEELLQRFRSERQMLAALDHPNIVKLLDGGSTDQGLPYLVMDYVEGDPIDEYCDSQKLSTESRLRLFRQVCQAVQYAHENHVIHRDLKPSNILVTPQGIPKLLDFGIAKVLEPTGDSQALITQTRTRRMTPAYASPEQVKATAVTAATDVYSLGVILYELLTGHRPYKLKQSTPAEIERAICEEDPEKPSTAVDRVETISLGEGLTLTKTPETVSQTREGDPGKLRRSLRGDLDTILLMALQKEPQRRYASVQALSEDIQRHLDHLPVRARRSTVTYRSSKFLKRHKLEALTLAAAAILLSAGAIFIRWEEKQATQRARMEVVEQYIPGRRSVAVLGFKNLSGRADTSWVSTALSEMLTTELAAGGKLRTISGENVARVRTDLSLPETDSLAPQTLTRVRHNLGSDYVVLGSYLDLGGSSQPVRLDVRLQDAVAGETISALAFNGSEQDLPNLIVQAGDRLREKLGTAAPSAAETQRIKAAQSSRLDASRDYAEGLAKLRAFDALGARDSLQKAIADDPSYAMAHSALAEALSRLGYESEAVSEAKKAFALASNLPREQSLLVEGQYNQAAHQNGKAVEIYRTLFNFFPDNLDYGLRLAGTQTSAGKPNDSLGTIEMLRKLPSPLRDDPRIDLAEAETAGPMADNRREANAAATAERKGEALGARLLVARAQLLEASALRALGDRKGAQAASEHAAQLFAAAGDRFGEAQARRNVGVIEADLGNMEGGKKELQQSLKILHDLGSRAGEENLQAQIASVLYREGDVVGAKEAIQQSMTLARDLGNRLDEAHGLNVLAALESDQGDIAHAKAHYQQALAIDREIGNQSGAARVLNNLGNLLMAEGDSAGAKSSFQECIAISRRTGDKDDLGIALMNLAGLVFNLGEVAPAKKLFSESLEVLQASGNQAAASYALYALADIQATQGDLEAGRKGQEQALAIREKIGAKEDAAASRQSLADIALEQGLASDAETLARQAAEEFHAAKDVGREADADRYLSQALRAQGKLSDAQKVMYTARELADQSGDGSTRVSTNIEYARIQAVSGKADEATNLLKTTIAQAQKGGYINFLLEARLALGQIEIDSGRFKAGQDELSSLEQDARKRGFLLIARNAAAARKRKTAASITEPR